eukprot:6442944-Prymnesium_polylepis.1
MDVVNLISEHDPADDVPDWALPLHMAAPGEGLPQSHAEEPECTGSTPLCDEPMDDALPGEDAPADDAAGDGPGAGDAADALPGAADGGGAAKAPRRAQTAINFYSSTARRKLRKEGLTEEQMRQAVLQGWEVLPAEERAPYEAKAAQDHVRYQQQLAAFTAGGGGGANGAGGGGGGSSKGGGSSTPLQKVNIALLGVSARVSAAPGGADEP